MRGDKGFPLFSFSKDFFFKISKQSGIPKPVVGSSKIISGLNKKAKTALTFG